MCKRDGLFVRGQNVAVVPEDEMVDALVEWATYIHENGVEAALERARATSEAARRAADGLRWLGAAGAGAAAAYVLFRWMG